jgi:hypothetical protein
MIEVFFSSLYSIIGAILLASFVGYVSWRNNFKVRRANACAVFRSAVLSELGLIHPKPAVWPENIDVLLRSHFTALQIAVEPSRVRIAYHSKLSKGTRCVPYRAYVWTLFKLLLGYLVPLQSRVFGFFLCRAGQ